MDYLETLARFEQLQAALVVLKAEEQALREGLFYGTFPNPIEGTNNYPLPDGRVVTGVLKMNRKILPEEYKKRWHEITQAAGLSGKVASGLIKTKYDLAVGPYKKLNEEQRQLVDGILEVKPGLPTLMIKPAKE